MMNKYLVYFYDADTEEDQEPRIMNAAEIFNFMDMDDCHWVRIAQIYLLRKGRSPSPCKFAGTWHDLKDPLKMEIVSRTGKTIYDRGWGTDH